MIAGIMPNTEINVLWVFACSALVMSMQIGFCMLESGLVRSKNTINVAFKNLLDMCVAALGFWTVSFALMYGSSCGWIGTSGFFHSSVGEDLSTTAFFLFQMMFCATAATIVSGAVAERMRFASYLVLTAIVSCIIYPIAGGWAWNPDGWLRQLGFIDFAGSTVVHSTGGWVALAAVAIIGPRLGRYNSTQPLASSHSLVTSTMGVLILFVGWLGFNGGSTLRLDAHVGPILINTVLAGSAGCLTAMAAVWTRKRLPLLPETLNGCVGGLVAVTAGCHALSASDAVIVGAVGGLISYVATLALDRLKIDDVVGASAAHAFPGIWGTLSVALFGDAVILGTGLDFWRQLGVQALGCGVFIAWAGGVGWVLLSLANRLMPLRVDEKGERIGLNVAEHGASTEIIDLLTEMSRHSSEGEFTSHLEFETQTEVGQIATQYNKVIGKVVDEMDMRETFARRLEQERLALDESQRKMISSIEYARRIQEAILPRAEFLNHVLPEHFIIYNPRDIVSGDFYWCVARDESVFVAVVDCTGHGVPGAFMSMIGYVVLQQLVIERGLSEPAEILAQMHTRVRASLGQHRPDSDNKDGMDVALLRMDPERLVFAGAGLPLLWMEPGTHGVQCGEIRGDRHGIGGGKHEPQQLSFTQHQLPRRPGLCVYLFTDGIVQQPNHLRRAFDKSGLRTMLSSICDQKMENQKAAVSSGLELFRGGAAQRDDITLIGIRANPLLPDEHHA